MSTPDPSHDTDSASHAHEEPLPEEPKTPFWVTALGVGLLLSGALGYLVLHEPDETPEAAPDAAASAAEAEASAKPEARPRPTIRRRPEGRKPPPRGSARRPRPNMPNIRNLLPKKNPGEPK